MKMITTIIMYVLSVTVKKQYIKVLSHLVVKMQTFNSNAKLQLCKMELLQRDQNTLKCR